MDDFLKKGNKEQASPSQQQTPQGDQQPKQPGYQPTQNQSQFFDPNNSGVKNKDGTVNAKQFDINNYATLPKGIKTTEIKNRSQGLSEFLNRDDAKMSIDIESIRKNIDDQPEQTSSWWWNTKKTLKSTRKMQMDDVDRYISNQKRKQAKVPLKIQFKTWFDRQFLVMSGSKSIYIWKSRVFEEMVYLYIPRLIFMTFSCYAIFSITYRQKKDAKMLHSVRSHRQEKIDDQILEIEKVLNRDENKFVPGQNVEYDKTYSGDQYEYLYQQEEKDMQDELFAAYDNMVPETEEQNYFEEEDIK